MPPSSVGWDAVLYPRKDSHTNKKMAKLDDLRVVDDDWSHEMDEQCKKVNRCA